MNKIILVVTKKTEESNIIENDGVTLEREVTECFNKKVTFELKHPQDRVAPFISFSFFFSPPPPSPFCLFGAS